MDDIPVLRGRKRASFARDQIADVEEVEPGRKQSVFVVVRLVSGEDVRLDLGGLPHATEVTP